MQMVGLMNEQCGKETCYDIIDKVLHIQASYSIIATKNEVIQYPRK